MEEFGDRSSQKYSEKIEDVECPFCHKAKISVTFIAGYMSWSVSRIAAKSARTRYFHDPRIKVNSNCPNCKATKADIKDALERGSGGQKSPEERLKRLQDSGLPTRIEE
jgi:hypothetical protein